MLGIRSKGKSIKVEVGCFFVTSFESIGDSDVDPNSNIIGSNIKSSMIEFDGFISSA